MSGVAVVLAVAAALILAILVAELIAAGVRALGRRRWLPVRLSHSTRPSLRVLLAVLFCWAAVSMVSDPVSRGFTRVMTALTILTSTWLLAVVFPDITDVAMRRHRVDSRGRRHARGSATLARLVRRTVRWFVALVGLSAALLVVEATRPAAVVVGGAALYAFLVLTVALVPVLQDFVAGVELAMTDAVRLDDVIVVDGEWGRVEEITATYVLVQAWDDRRIVVPTRHLTRAPFENWTRRSADLLGTVDLDIDVSMPVAKVRAELGRLVENNDLWDRRLAVLQVVDATEHHVRVRAVISAADAPQLMDLRCDVREGLVEWLRLQRHGRGAEMPVRTRPEHGEPLGVAIGSAIGSAIGAATEPKGHDAEPATGEGPDRTALVDPRRDVRLFTGSVFAVERSQVFTGPGEDVLAERDATGNGSA
jgi:small-conductance mechanosensitive channel